MKAIHRSAWATLILGIMIGCAGEENAAPPAAGPTGGPKVAPPGPPPAVPKEPGKATPSKEMIPPPPAPDSKEKKPGAEAPKVEGPKTGQADASAAKLSDEELAEIRKLPAAEQDAAIKQAVCPVSGEHLGSMEKPFKVTAEGRTFYLCCGNCEKEVKSDPKSVIAKLDGKK